MNYNKYIKKSYNISATYSNEMLRVYKDSGSDRLFITLEINGGNEGDITIRGKEMAEQLHFMLGQMLGK